MLPEDYWAGLSDAAIYAVTSELDELTGMHRWVAEQRREQGAAEE